LKKQISLFVFSVFFLAQFGKVINFCFCTMTVYQQTKTLACDCEKQLFAAVKTDNTSKNQSPQNIAAPQPPEELFHFSNLSGFTHTHMVCFGVWPATGTETLYNKFGKDIFHPPLPIS
jgi:hypothetical protein